MTNDNRVCDKEGKLPLPEFNSLIQRIYAALDDLKSNAITTRNKSEMLSPVSDSKSCCKEYDETQIGPCVTEILENILFDIGEINIIVTSAKENLIKFI